MISPYLEGDHAAATISRLRETLARIAEMAAAECSPAQMRRIANLARHHLPDAAADKAHAARPERAA